MLEYSNIFINEDVCNRRRHLQLLRVYIFLISINNYVRLSVLSACMITPRIIELSCQHNLNLQL